MPEKPLTFQETLFDPSLARMKSIRLTSNFYRTHMGDKTLRWEIRERSEGKLERILNEKN